MSIEYYQQPILSYLHEIADVVLEIEAELRRRDRWEMQRPPTEYLASREPFCCDTLQVTQWLQWIFLPRMKVVLEGHEALPTESSIAAYAEECFRNDPEPWGRLIELLQRYDDLIGEAALAAA